MSLCQARKRGRIAVGGRNKSRSVRTQIKSPLGGEGMIKRGLQTPESKGTTIPILRSLCRLLGVSGLSGNPLESARRDEAHYKQVLSAEAIRIFPGFPISVRSLKRGIEHRSFVSLLSPDARTHGTVADFVDGLGIYFRGLFHNGFLMYPLVERLTKIATPMYLLLMGKDEGVQLRCRSYR